jgi:hypothetical protein
VSLIPQKAQNVACVAKRTGVSQFGIGETRRDEIRWRVWPPSTLQESGVVVLGLAVRTREVRAHARCSVDLAGGRAEASFARPLRGALSVSPRDNRGLNARPCAGVHEFRDVARNVRQVPIVPGEATRFPTLNQNPRLQDSDSATAKNPTERRHSRGLCQKAEKGILDFDEVLNLGPFNQTRESSRTCLEACES